MAKKPADSFTAEEREAMKARAAELKSARTRGEGEADLLSKIAEMGEHDRHLAERIHALVTAAAPELFPKTWYGMPAWARGDKIVCFFQAAEKFKTRYATFGFNAEAKLDDGHLWPTAFAVTKLTAAEEAKITALVKKAVG